MVKCADYYTKRTAMMIVRFMQRNYANLMLKTCCELAVALDKKPKKNCFASNLDSVRRTPCCLSHTMYSTYILNPKPLDCTVRVNG